MNIGAAACLVLLFVYALPRIKRDIYWIWGKRD